MPEGRLDQQGRKGDYATVTMGVSLQASLCRTRRLGAAGVRAEQTLGAQEQKWVPWMGLTKPGTAGAWAGRVWEQENCRIHG